MDQISSDAVKENDDQNEVIKVPLESNFPILFAALESATTIDDESYWKRRYQSLYGEHTQLNDGVICPWWRRRFFERYVSSVVQEISTNHDYYHNQHRVSQWKRTVRL